MADVRIAEDWKDILAEEFTKPYFDNLVAFVKQEYASGWYTLLGAIYSAPSTSVDLTT